MREQLFPQSFWERYTLTNLATHKPPRSPRAEGGEETLMSVAGLGAQNRAQLINEWSGNIFCMSIDVAVVGTAQIEIVQQYWHERLL